MSLKRCLICFILQNLKSLKTKLVDHQDILKIVPKNLWSVANVIHYKSLRLAKLEQKWNDKTNGRNSLMIYVSGKATKVSKFLLHIEIEKKFLSIWKPEWIHKTEIWWKFSDIETPICIKTWLWELVDEIPQFENFPLFIGSD